MRYFYGADRDLLQTRAIWWSCHLLHIIKTFLDLVLHLWRLSCLQVRAAQSKLFRARFHSLSGKPAPTFNHRAGPQLNSLQFVTGFAAMVCWKTQHGRKPLTVEVTSLLTASCSSTSSILYFCPFQLMEQLLNQGYFRSRSSLPSAQHSSQADTPSQHPNS